MQAQNKAAFEREKEAVGDRQRRQQERDAAERVAEHASGRRRAKARARRAEEVEEQHARRQQDADDRWVRDLDRARIRAAFVGSPAIAVPADTASDQQGRLLGIDDLLDAMDRVWRELDLLDLEGDVAALNLRLDGFGVGQLSGRALTLLETGQAPKVWQDLAGRALCPARLALAGDGDDGGAGLVRRVVGIKADVALYFQSGRPDMRLADIVQGLLLPRLLGRVRKIRSSVTSSNQRVRAAVGEAEIDHSIDLDRSYVRGARIRVEHVGGGFIDARIDVELAGKRFAASHRNLSLPAGAVRWDPDREEAKRSVIQKALASRHRVERGDVAWTALGLTRNLVVIALPPTRGKPGCREKAHRCQLVKVGKSLLARLDVGKYVSVIEPHRDGRPHLNLILYLPGRVDAADLQMVIDRTTEDLKLGPNAIRLADFVNDLEDDRAAEAGFALAAYLTKGIRLLPGEAPTPDALDRGHLVWRTWSWVHRLGQVVTMSRLPKAVPGAGVALDKQTVRNKQKSHPPPDQGLRPEKPPTPIPAGHRIQSPRRRWHECHRLRGEGFSMAEIARRLKMDRHLVSDLLGRPEPQDHRDRRRP